MMEVWILESGIACLKESDGVGDKKGEKESWLLSVEEMRKEEEDSKETEGEIKLFFVLYLPQRM